MNQYYIDPNDCRKEINMLLLQLRVTGIFLVCGKSFLTLPIHDLLHKLCASAGIKMTYFSDFAPNPTYDSVKEGVQAFHKSGCNFILAAGGGSAIDVAKCVKLFADMKSDEEYLSQKIVSNDIPMMAIPTTAGTGSEATQFAVIYVSGEKHSIEHESALPQYVLLYHDSLRTLCDYQKKATVCDALAHAIESYWSVHSTSESKQWSEKAMQIILEYAGKYIMGDESCYGQMMLAANYAGRAINMTKTTAAHAMCYKLTTILNIPHGHAVMLCLPEVWEYMYRHLEACVDTRGEQYLRSTLTDLAHCLRQDTCQEAIEYLKNLRNAWQLGMPARVEEDQAAKLANSVNTERLGNFPVSISREHLMHIYQCILQGEAVK